MKNEKMQNEVRPVPLSRRRLVGALGMAAARLAITYEGKGAPGASTKQGAGPLELVAPAAVIQGWWAGLVGPVSAARQRRRQRG